MTDSLLSGLRALDLTDEKGFVCGKILAALGVEVIKVEKPGGDMARNIPPYINNIPGPERSLYWLAFNTDKRSITLNLEDKQGQEIFRKLVEKSDFVIESFIPGYLDNLGLGYETLSKLNPRIIMTSITPFGQKGPYAQYKGCELIISAMSGVMDNCGDPDRPPIREGPDSIYFRGNAAAALGTIIAHNYCDITGEGQYIDVSLQEVDASRTFLNMVSWEFNKCLMKRNGPFRQMGNRSTRQVWSCKDGNLFWTLTGGVVGKHGNQAMSDWLDDEGIENPMHKITKWDELDMAKLNIETIRVWESTINKLFMKYTKKEIAKEALKRGIGLTVVNNPADVLENQRLIERDYWVDIECPEAGFKLTYPRYFFLCDQSENYIRYEAPLVGQDNDQIYGKEIGLPPEKIKLLEKEGII